MSRSIAPVKRFEFDSWIATPRRLLQEWWNRYCYRQRLRALLLMGPHLIADIGMTMEEAEREADNPFWQSRHLPPLRYF